MDKNLSKFSKPEQIALAAMFYFGQVFVCCIFINKNMLEWFQLIICKEQIYKPLQQKPSHIVILIKKRRRADPNAAQLLYQTDKSSTRRCCTKKLLLKISQHSQESTCVGVSYSTYKETPTQMFVCFQFPAANFLRTSMSKNIWLRVLLN